jgi:anti-sigma factor RsiW
MSLSTERMLKLMAYADGELEGTERLEVEMWLQSDLDAVRFANELAGLGDLVTTGHRASSTAKTIASFDIADAVMAKVEETSAAVTKAAPSNVVSLETRRQKNLKVGASIAAALALAASVFVMTRSKEDAPMARAPGIVTTSPAPGTTVATAESDPGSGVDVDVDETPGDSVRVFYLANETNPTTSVMVWVDESGGK